MERIQELINNNDLMKFIGYNRPEVALSLASVAREFHDDPEWLGLRLRNPQSIRFFETTEEAAILAYLTKIRRDMRYKPSRDDDDAGLRACIAKNYALCVFTLLQDPLTNPAAGRNAAIRWASEHGHTFIVQQLLADARVDPSANNDDALYMACQNGHTEVVRLLLQDDRVDPTVNDNEIIRMAITSGYTEIVRLLLAVPEVDPRDDDFDVLADACEHGYTEIVRMLLEDGRVDPTEMDFNALRVAAMSGHLDIVQLFLQDPRTTARGRDIANLGMLEGPNGPLTKGGLQEYGDDKHRDIIASFL